MHFLIKHWAPYPRRCHSPCPLESTDFITGKTEWIERTFSTCNFSFILRGGGEFHHAGRRWPVVAPCVITQWPGEPVRYGARPPHGAWDELYLIYDAARMAWLQRRGFVVKSRPAWPVARPEIIWQLAEELRVLTGSAHPEQEADRVDLVCERLVLESLLPAAEPEDEAVRHIVARLRDRLGEPVDFAALARRHGMSLPTLRRRWLATLRVTPGRWLLDQRIRAASRMLAETRQPVGAIAAATGFGDALYFSRRFKLETTLTPTEYRRRHQMVRSQLTAEARRRGGIFHH
ncbi:MAG: helix-turn-helix domain-containing protein [Verrucomicrobiales bacterium]|nr:helix-turn-helix domain-containing protein [Verrucomicrobiales bacterium]